MSKKPQLCTEVLTDSFTENQSGETIDLVESDLETNQSTTESAMGKQLPTLANAGNKSFLGEFEMDNLSEM